MYREPYLQIVFGITLCAVMGVSTVAPVLPSIAVAFDVSPVMVGWVVAAFTLPGMVVAPVAGILADRLGRRPVLVASLLVAGGAGVGCGLAPDFYTLLLFRFVQGVGAAPLGVLMTTLIGDRYDGAELGRAMGYNTSVLSVGLMFFPLVGGLLGMVHWRVVFALPLVAIAWAWVVHARLDAAGGDTSQSIGDYLRDASAAMNHAHILTLFVASLSAFVLIFGPFITYAPLYMDAVFGAGPLTLGLVISGSAVVTGLLSWKFGAIAGYFGERWLMSISFVFYALCMVLIPLMGSLWMMVVPVVIYGMAHGLNVPSMMTLLNRYATREYRGAFVAANGTLLRGGQFVGPVLMAGVLAVSSIEWVFYAGALIGGVTAVACFVWLREPAAKVAVHTPKATADSGEAPHPKP